MKTFISAFLLLFSSMTFAYSVQISDKEICEKVKTEIVTNQGTTVYTFQAYFLLNSMVSNSKCEYKVSWIPLFFETIPFDQIEIFGFGIREEGEVGYIWLN